MQLKTSGAAGVGDEAVATSGVAWVGRLGRVSRLVQRHLAPRSAVSLAQAEVLALLEADDAMPVSEVALRRGCSQPAMSQMVERLVAAGLATRTSSERDRRVAEVSVTEQGRRVLADNRRRAASVLDGRVDRLSPEERRVLDAAAPVLDRLLDDQPREIPSHEEA